MDGTAPRPPPVLRPPLGSPEWGPAHWHVLAHLERRRIAGDAFVIDAAQPLVASERSRNALVSGQPVGSSPFDPTKEPRDDWDCLHDLAGAGLFTAAPNDLVVGTHLQLSAVGERVIHALREHKRHGGSFSNVPASLVADLLPDPPVSRATGPTVRRQRP